MSKATPQAVRATRARLYPREFAASRHGAEDVDDKIAYVAVNRLVLGRRNWLFTWLDEGGARTGDILSIIATCIAHDVNPRAYLPRVVHCIVHGWPQAKLRDLLPDRMLVEHPELYGS